MQQFKAILSDFDGTLVNRDLAFNPSVPELIGKIREKGIRFSVSTGRPYYAPIRNVLQQLPVSDIHVFHGGGIIMDTRNDKIISEQPINRKSLKQIALYLDSRHLFYIFENVKHAYYSRPYRFTSFFYADETIIKPMSDFKYTVPIVKVLISAIVNKLTDEQVEKHMKKTKKLANDIELLKFKFGPSYFGMDITSIKATKNTALLGYAKYLGISPKEIIVIGDSYNDFPLFMAAGYKIAMSHAPADLKEMADFIAPNDTNQGMKEALTHVLEKIR